MSGQREMFDTLADARADLRANRRDGTHCACCGQMVRLYSRKLNSGMARWLVALERAGGWARSSEITKSLAGRLSGTDATALLPHWGLIEVRPEEKGVWRVTEKGRQFIARELRVPSHVLVYLGECEGFEGEEIDIRHALSDRFDLDELLSGTGDSDEPCS